MIYIILDLEATCWEDKAKAPNEIIEIGAVAITTTREIIGEFNTFVKPSINPVLSDFCKKLTSIRQQDVANAPYYPEANQAFQDWIEQFEPPYWLCSWGFYDKKQFKQDCELHGLDTSWLKSHVSLKHQYSSISGTRRPLGMKNALLQEGFKLDGTHHRGIDDARNIAKIFLKYFKSWKFS